MATTQLRLRFRCGGCQALIGAPRQAAGKLGTCPKCRRRVLIPVPGPTASSDMSLVVRSTNAPILWPNTVLQAFQVEHPSLSSDESVILSPPRGTRTGDPYLGRRLGDFELDGLVSAGGRIRVYRGRQLSLQRRVAVKIVTDPNMSAGRLQQARREAGALARLNHPNILTVIAFGAEVGFCWTAMEHADGGSIADWLQGGAVPWPTGYWWLRQALSGLQAAHTAGVVHRHINPHNLMLRQSGTIRIGDFGDVRPSGEPTSLDNPRVVAESFAYVAPEQVLGTGVDGRTDLYRLGAAFYHVFAGRSPFAGSPPHEMLQKHAHETLLPLEQAAPQVPLPLCRFIARLTEKEPGLRYQSAAAALTDLEGYEKFDLSGVKSHPGGFRPAAGAATAGT